MLRRLRFNFWYFGRPPWDSGISPPELFDYIANHRPGRAIDIGCGTGTNVITLAQHGWQVTGVDFAPRAVRIAERKIRDANVKVNLSVNDATKLDGIMGPFDLGFDLGCFHGIGNKSEYLAQLDRVLASQGHWLMYGFLKSDPGLSGPGLTQSDFDSIEAGGLRLISRQDGFDKRGRPSAWSLFHKRG
jgi:ubiquinone/menaquinone biosynthesis C-methylase UbiE